MVIGDKLYKPVKGTDYAEVSVWCSLHDAHLEDKGEYYEICENPTPEITEKDYDDAMEAHLLKERCDRGYTTREPDSYINSGVVKWRQDAQDWVDHKDIVMLYALQVENDYKAGLPVPTLEEFKANLPKIEWTYTYDV